MSYDIIVQRYVGIVVCTNYTCSYYFVHVRLNSVQRSDIVATDMQLNACRTLCRRIMNSKAAPVATVSTR